MKLWIHRSRRSTGKYLNLARIGTLLLVLALPLALSVGSHADQRLASTLATSPVFANTDQYTPTIFEVGYPCWTNFIFHTNYPPLAAKFQHVPLPCYFWPSRGTDGEAVVIDRGLADGKPRTYEFWQAFALNGQWHVRWGGADDDENFIQTPYGRAWANSWEGTSASGLAFVPGVITVADLQAGAIRHAIHMQVKTSCQTWVWPATRTDLHASPTGTNDCYEFGTAYKLPPGFAIPASWPRVLRLIAAAARDYGLVITESNNYGVGFRFENYVRSWAHWSPDGRVVNPYSDPARPNLNFFECTAADIWRCSPDQNHLFRPFGVVYPPNTQTFWQALVQVNP